ncbi:hypothetical protein [Mesoplasma melaleucae]|nr:hypothetical protein [Mesoplasma melaleucae]
MGESNFQITDEGIKFGTSSSNTTNSQNEKSSLNWANVKSTLVACETGMG